MASMNEAVAGLLREYAELLAITGGDPTSTSSMSRARSQSASGVPWSSAPSKPL
jgi:hypothetical protein